MTNETRIRLGAVLYEMRQNKGLSARGLSEATNGVLSTGTISNIENGLGSPTLDTLKNFAEFYEMHVWEILKMSEI